ncbi:MAG: hypothetical protein ACJA1Q_002157 [Pseudohongiellaceae bacterium]|jgi:hypothetical protein
MDKQLSKLLKLAIPDHKQFRCQANLFMANVLAVSHYYFDVAPKFPHEIPFLS